MVPLALLIQSISKWCTISVSFNCRAQTRHSGFPSAFSHVSDQEWLVTEGGVELIGLSRAVSRLNKAAVDVDRKINLCLRVTAQIWILQNVHSQMGSSNSKRGLIGNNISQVKGRGFESA